MERVEDESTHKPVLLSEVLDAFHLSAPLKRRVKIVDATLGLGGHTVALVKSGAYVLGIDADSGTLKLAEKKLSIACPIPEGQVNDLQGLWKLRHGNFKDIDKIAKEEGFEKVNGIIMDLGVSSPQITSSVRGISFRNDKANLDMRLDPDSQNVRGADILNALRLDQLVDLFEKVLSRNLSIKLASEIIKAREIKKIEIVSDFKRVIDKVVKPKKRLQPYTLPFLSLRIAVNSELDNLSDGLKKSLGLLEKGGRLAVISFHSGEDRLVKRFFAEAGRSGYKPLDGLITPKVDEVRDNPRARSAKMRILEKL